VRKNLLLIAVLMSAASVGCISEGDSSSQVESSQSALCTPTKLALAAAVSSGAPIQAAKNAIDGNTGTRWESAYSDPQWIYVDLGAVKTVTEVRIDWQHAAAKNYRVDVSNDAVTWSAAVITNTGGIAVDHRIDDLTGFSVSARYVRMFGTARATQYGYSIWELTVYDGSSCGGTGSAGAGGGGGSAGAGTAGKGGTAGGGGSAGSSCVSGALALTTAVASAAPKQVAKNAIDRNTGTRWESAYSDPQWIYVDLGAVKTVTEVRIDWQHAAAKDYRIDVSNDAVTWSAAVITNTGGIAVDHRIDDLTGFSVSARYVRMFGTARATAYGYSIWEMTVSGYDPAACSTNLLTAGWNHADVTSNFTPVAGYTFGASKNAISFDYTGQTFATSTTDEPPRLELTQSVTIPKAGSTWRLTLTISGINNQTTLPPQFLAAVGGVFASTYAPTVATVAGSAQLVRVGSLTSGAQLTADVSVSLTAGQVVDVTLDDVPTFTESADGKTGTGLQKFNVTDVSLARLN
jgi:hypothetical protein